MHLTVDGDPKPICPHCEKRLGKVISMPLRSEEEAVDVSGHETHILVCPHCSKVLGSQRGYSW